MRPRHGHERNGSEAVASLVGRALACAAGVAFFRAGLVALRFVLEPDGTRLAIAAASASALAGVAWCFAPACGAAWAARRWSARAPLVLVPVALLSFAFATHRLPAQAAYSPGWETSRAIYANVGGAAVALVATACLLPGVGRRRWLARTVAVAAIAALALAALVWGRAPRGAPASWPARPNVIVISLDTLRADRLGCYGYGKPTTPVIDRFAEGALLFTNAYSQAPWTLTSHMTLLTGLHPAAHGVGKDRALAASVPTLAELLRDAGWRTAAVVDGRAKWLDAKFGFDQGFEVYRSVRGEVDVRIDHVLTVLDEVEDEAFFLFAHFFDAHSDGGRLPYDADPEDLEQFTAWYDGDYEGCGPSGRCGSDRLVELNDTDEELGEAERRYLSDLYDAGVRTMDRALGRLLDELETRGLHDNTVILITSDHGEELWDHGRWLHTQYFDECLRVPFLLRVPGVAAGTRGVQVGLVDVTPTVLELAGVAIPPTQQGLSIAAQLSAPAPIDREHLSFAGEGKALGLRAGSWLLFRERGTPDQQGPAWRVFDREEDPDQKRDLSGEGDAPAELDDWIKVLRQENAHSTVLRDGGQGARVEIDASERAALEALGYTGD